MPINITELDINEVAAMLLDAAAYINTPQGQNDFDELYQEIFGPDSKFSDNEKVEILNSVDEDDNSVVALLLLGIIDQSKQQNVNDAFGKMVTLPFKSRKKPSFTNDDQKRINLVLNNPLLNNKQETLDSLLLLAAYLIDNEEIIKFLITAGANINYMGQNLNTPLMLAIRGANAANVKFMLDSNVDSSKRNRFGDNGLDIALRNASHSIIRVFEPDLTKFGYTELMIAIIDGNYDKARQLIAENQGKINLVNNAGFSALLFATMQYKKCDPENTVVRNAIFELIMDLLKHGADISVETKDRFNFIKLLSGSGLLAEDKTYKSIIDYCFSQEFIENKNGKNLLHYVMELAPELAYSVIINLKKFYGNGYEQFLNALDKDGNSPLRYLALSLNSNDNTTNANLNINLFNLIDQYNLKFIWHNQETKSQLHLKIFFDSQAEKTIETDLSKIDIKPHLEIADETGKTPLHYACILNKVEYTHFLVESGANIFSADNAQRTPVHYAAINSILFPFTNVNQQQVFNSEDIFGLTPLVLYYQYANSESILDMMNMELASIANNPDKAPIINKVLLNLHLANIKSIPDIERAIATIESNSDLTYRQKLALLAGLNNYLNIKYKYLFPAQQETILLGIINQAAQRILNKEFSNSEQYQQTNFLPQALGAEFEIANVQFATFIPKQYLEAWYPITIEKDPSVAASGLSMFGNQESDANTEIVTLIIKSATQFEMIKDMCSALTAAGSMVNKSCGFHIHVNCRGKNDGSNPVPPLFEPSSKEELDYIKNLLLNFISMKQLLRGIIRGGAMFAEHGGAYVENISKYRDQILAATSVTELQVILSHNKSIDLTALDKHGTIEFRLHEGLIDPTLFAAWADAIYRLVNISVKQTKKQPAAQPFEDIEQLVYLLIVMRDYANTWSTQARRTATAETSEALAYPVVDPSKYDARSAQLQIIDAPLYKMMRIVLNNDYSKPMLTHASTSSDGAILTAFDHHKKHTSLIHDDDPLLNQLFAVIPQSNSREENIILLGELEKLITFAADNTGMISVNLPKDYLVKIVDALKIKVSGMDLKTGVSFNSP
jgi:ankyrin repeat protein